MSNGLGRIGTLSFTYFSVVDKFRVLHRTFGLVRIPAVTKTRHTIK